MISVFSLPDRHSASLQPSCPETSGPAGSHAHTPWGFGCGHRAVCAMTGALCGWLRRRPDTAAGEFPKQLPSVSFLTFSFCEIPPAQAATPYKGLASHTAHLSNLTRGYLDEGPSRPNSQLSAAGVHSLHPYSPL